ncbi:Complex III assembly protein translocase and chaperone [Metarhizium acridum]|nr:Complex III assembly protein translocase and chaperone [Metarhizium acridum]
MMLRIGEATKYQAGKMWDRFYGDEDNSGSGKEHFLRRLDELGLFGTNPDGTPSKRQTSTAAIQGLFLFNKSNMQGAIDMAEGLIPRNFEEEDAASDAAHK